MTLRLPLPPDLEGKLREHAAAAGKDIETFVLETLEERTTGSTGPSDRGSRLATDQRVAEWLAWTASHPPVGYFVDDSRESIYAGRGE